MGHFYRRGRGLRRGREFPCQAQFEHLPHVFFHYYCYCYCYCCCCCCFHRFLLRSLLPHHRRALPLPPPLLHLLIRLEDPLVFFFPPFTIFVFLSFPLFPFPSYQIE